MNAKEIVNRARNFLAQRDEYFTYDPQLDEWSMWSGGQRVLRGTADGFENALQFSQRVVFNADRRSVQGAGQR